MIDSREFFKIFEIPFPKIKFEFLFTTFSSSKIFREGRNQWITNNSMFFKNNFSSPKKTLTVDLKIIEIDLKGIIFETYIHMKTCAYFKMRRSTFLFIFLFVKNWKQLINLFTLESFLILLDSATIIFKKFESQYSLVCFS